jgi:hypothetical protein
VIHPINAHAAPDWARRIRKGPRGPRHTGRGPLRGHSGQSSLVPPPTAPDPHACCPIARRLSLLNYLFYTCSSARHKDVLFWRVPRFTWAQTQMWCPIWMFFRFNEFLISVGIYFRCIMWLQVNFIKKFHQKYSFCGAFSLKLSQFYEIANLVWSSTSNL